MIRSAESDQTHEYQSAGTRVLRESSQGLLGRSEPAAIRVDSYVYLIEVRDLQLRKTLVYGGLMSIEAGLRPIVSIG